MTALAGWKQATAPSEADVLRMSRPDAEEELLEGGFRTALRRSRRILVDLLGQWRALEATQPRPAQSDDADPKCKKTGQNFRESPLKQFSIENVRNCGMSVF